MPDTHRDDLRLIEAGFPCHQVGAETQRERGASSALPPLYFLHVWWARRPLTPSRAAILASLLPADTDPDWFLRQLGIEKRIIAWNGQAWTLTGKILDFVVTPEDGVEGVWVDDRVLALMRKENQRRAENLELIAQLKEGDPTLANDPVLMRWEAESQPIPPPYPRENSFLPVQRVAADPAWANERISFENARGIRTNESKYGYDRAYASAPVAETFSGKTVLDPTAGGGSIPFEALRLGHKVIANELNPVASVILYATLEYPSQYGMELVEPIEKWGNKLREAMVEKLIDLFPASALDGDELQFLRNYLHLCPELISDYTQEQLDGFLYCRQVTCPFCGGEAPLLNTCWLSKEAGKPWGVRIVTDGKPKNGTVRFEPYRVAKGKGPKGEDPNLATVKQGVGTCVHCRQAIAAEEIKKQARGESGLGRWRDRLYCVVAVRFQPKLDKSGKPQYYKSGDKAGEIKTEKVRFFRAPNPTDLDALDRAEQRLRENWDRWDAAGLIPTENFPQGNDMRPVIYGMPRWCDMFTSRQLLGHVTLVEELNRLKPIILEKLGQDRGRAVVTYLQFAIDKCVDYNSKQTRWIAQRSQVSGTFGRHDFSLKWTFGEMIFTGPNSGAAWGFSQIIDAYAGLVELSNSNLASYQHENYINIINGTASHMDATQDESIDLICMDPPYYNNVQYAELSNYYYVWEKRTLKDQYPHIFSRRLANIQEEAVANPDRDGGADQAKDAYEKKMGEIFAECRRVLKPEGIMTIMFTHKSQDAWETLTRSLIENGWIITSAFPVESEFANSQHIMDNASASSSVFLSCRKRRSEAQEPAVWTGFGGSGVLQRIRQAVEEGLKEFAALKLNPVDEMVASYGRALRVLSEHWPVLDGDELVGPARAMNEASRVVAENQIKRITGGRLHVEDLQPEAAMALTLLGIYGLAEFPYDEALNLSRSLNIELRSFPGGYHLDGRFVGINTAASSSRRAAKTKAEESGFHAPLVRQGSKLRLARPEERDPRRMNEPQSEWDILQGTILAFREGDVPVARSYLEKHAGVRSAAIRDLLEVWAAEVTEETLRKEAQALLFGLK